MLSTEIFWPLASTTVRAVLDVDNGHMVLVADSPDNLTTGDDADVVLALFHPASAEEADEMLRSHGVAGNWVWLAEGETVPVPPPLAMLNNQRDTPPATTV